MNTVWRILGAVKGEPLCFRAVFPARVERFRRRRPRGLSGGILKEFPLIKQGESEQTLRREAGQKEGCPHNLMVFLQRSVSELKGSPPRLLSITVSEAVRGDSLCTRIPRRLVLCARKATEAVTDEVTQGGERGRKKSRWAWEEGGAGRISVKDLGPCLLDFGTKNIRPLMGGPMTTTDSSTGFFLGEAPASGEELVSCKSSCPVYRLG